MFIHKGKDDEVFNIPVYIDDVDKERGTLILDLPPAKKESDINYKTNFLSALGFEQSENQATMLEISGISFSKVLPRIGSYYFLPQKILNSEYWTEVNQEDEASHFLAFRAEYNGEELSFGKAINRKEYIIYGEVEESNYLTSILARLNHLTQDNNHVKLIANDVGQGNCNQIFFSCCSFIMYDFGSREKSKLNDALTNIGSKLLSDFRDCQLNRILCQNNGDKEVGLRIFILSHWDVDHYNALNQMEQRMLDLFDLFIVPKEIPNDTSDRAFKRLPVNKIVTVEMRGRKRRSPVRLQPIFRNNLFRLFRSSKSSNRNKSGLVLSVGTENSEAILPADHHYEQIDKIVYPYHTSNPLYFVIPHHGGHAGRVSKIRNWKNLKEVIYSVGSNQWGHPFIYVIDEVNAQRNVDLRHDTRHHNKYSKLI